MCFEKPLLWWLLETHVASACLRGLYSRPHPMQMEGAPGSWIFDRLVTLMRVKDPR